MPIDSLDDEKLETLETLGAKLIRDLERDAGKKTIDTKDGGKISGEEFRVGDSKPILDEIDTGLSGALRVSVHDVPVRDGVTIRSVQDASNGECGGCGSLPEPSGH